MELEKLLKKISVGEYREFVLFYSLKNREFKTELEMYFASKDEKMDLNKKYSEWNKKTVRKYQHRGFIDRRSVSGLAGDLQDIINTGFVLVEKHNFLDAFTLAKVALKETVKVITHCDDSSGRIGDTIAFCMELLARIANDPNAGNPLKKQLFSYLATVLKEDIYFDYGGFGYELLAIFESLAVELGQPEMFLKHLDNELSKPAKPYSDYSQNFYKAKKIQFLTSIGRLDEAEELVAQNLDIVEVRQCVVNKAIAGEDYLQAKKLIEEGIKIAEAKRHPGTVADRQKELLRIAFLEKDIEQIRHYSKHFAFDFGFDKAYYRIWKETYLPEEWKEVIDTHLQKSIAIDAYNYFPSIVASIYIEENYLDRLLALVRQEDLGHILYYHDVLLKDYPLDLCKSTCRR